MEEGLHEERRGQEQGGHYLTGPPTADTTQRPGSPAG